MKKIIAVILALLMMLSLVACFGGNDNTSDTGGNNDAGTTDGQTPEKKSLKINGVDISEYRIVYAKNPDAYKYTICKNIVTQDTEYDEQTANNLAALIEKYFGAKLSVVKDSKTATDKEIIIGNTSRGLEGDALAAFNATNDKDICGVQTDSSTTKNI